MLCYVLYKTIAQSWIFSNNILKLNTLIIHKRVYLFFQKGMKYDFWTRAPLIFINLHRIRKPKPIIKSFIQGLLGPFLSLKNTYIFKSVDFWLFVWTIITKQFINYTMKYNYSFYTRETILNISFRKFLFIYIFLSCLTCWVVIYLQ